MPQNEVKLTGHDLDVGGVVDNLKFLNVRGLPYNTVKLPKGVTVAEVSQKMGEKLQNDQAVTNALARISKAGA
jgi:hypothetical protein